jgi:hypothetical protein
VCQIFGLTHSTIRNREKDGLIPPIPRGPSGDRLIPIEWVRGWVANGFPGPNPGAATSPALPDALPVSGAETVGTIPSGPEVVVPEAPAGVSPPIDDDEYSRRSNAVRRVEDDVAMKRAEKELLIVSRDLEEARNPKPPMVAPGGDALTALIQQQTAMMQSLLQMVAQPKGPDAIDQATKIIAAFRESSKPVDLSDRPEGRLYNSLMTKMVERVGDKLFEPEAEGGGNGFLLEVAKVLAPLVGDIIRSRGASVPVGRTDSGGTIVPALPDTSGAPSHGIESLAPDPVPVLPATGEDVSEGGGVGFVEAMGDIFEMLGNLQAGGVGPDDAVQTLFQVIGPTPHILIVRMMKAPITALRVMAIGAGVPETAEMIGTPDGREWVLKVQAGLVDIYSGKGGDRNEASPL